MSPKKIIVMPLSSGKKTCSKLALKTPEQDSRRFSNESAGGFDFSQEGVIFNF